MAIFVYSGEDDQSRASAEIFTQPSKSLLTNDETVTLTDSFLPPNPFIDPTELTLKQKLGSRPNGLGELYKCTYKGREVAYRKTSFPRMSGFVLEEFNLEIISLKALDSNYLVTLIGASFNLPSVGIISSYMSNGSLFFMLHESSTRLLNSEKKKIIIELAQGLRELHSMSRFHGHLSSHNVFFDSESRVRIGDLGLEKIKKYAGVVINYTNKNAWSSPELLREASRTSVRPRASDDIYSFGVIV